MVTVPWPVATWVPAATTVVNEAPVPLTAATVRLSPSESVSLKSTEPLPVNVVVTLKGVVRVSAFAVGGLLATVIVADEVLFVVKSWVSFPPVTVAVLEMLGRLAAVLVPVMWTVRKELNGMLGFVGSVRTCCVTPSYFDMSKPSGFRPVMDHLTDSGRGSFRATPVTVPTPTLLTVTV